jgi:hypothetical protein
VAWLAACAPVSAQQNPAATLRLGGLLPSGVRASATESWGTHEFNVTNFADTDRRARVLMFFDGHPYVQYGRDVWVPAHASLATWMLVGPAPSEGPDMARDIQYLLYEQTGGTEHWVQPRGEERVRSRGILYRKREPFTTILLDPESLEEPPPGQLPQPDSSDEEALRLARAFRLVHKLSDHVPRLPVGPLPPVEQAFDGIDHFILASNRLDRDPGGMRALRRWLQLGGRVWVMLDLVELDTLAPLLGDALDFTVLDRVGLTSFRIEVESASQRMGESPPRRYEGPVEFVRVQLPPGEHVKYTVDGWPAWFTRQVGRGTVVVSTLGSRAWYRERTDRDPPSPYQDFPDMPIPEAPLEDLALELQPLRGQADFQVGSFSPLLTEEIGYSVVRRNTVVLVFASALLAALVAGIVLRRTHRPELLGWLGPVAALGAAGVFLGVGEASRRAAPPTVAVGEVVDTAPGQAELAVRGQLAVYRPDSGPAPIGAPHGGFFDLNMDDMKDQTRRLVLTDLDAWHWEDLTLPAGIRLASFRDTIPIDKPVVAAARFGPEGIEGHLNGPFEELSDALLSAPGARSIAVQIQPDGVFHATSAETLSRGQFLASAVLSDQQQRRQAIYRAFFSAPPTGALRDHPVLLAWARPVALRFDLAEQARTVGGALLVAPLRWERPAPGQRATIPGPLIPYQRILEDGPTKMTLESSENADMHLRFQLPNPVLPFKVERARLFVHMVAPSRRVTIAGRAGDQLVRVHRVDSPVDPFRVEIADERLLRLDDKGGFHLNLNIGGSLEGASPTEQLRRLSEKWTIDYLELEVTGHSEG